MQHLTVVGDMWRVNKFECVKQGSGVGRPNIRLQLQTDPDLQLY